MPFVLLAVAVILAAIVLMPLSIVQRYRMGVARQRARGWLATVNLVGIGLSLVMFVTSAAITSIWVPNAFSYTLAGTAMGCVLGILGLRLTRWEPAAGTLHFTPNRTLVLAVTLVVAARVLYGFWRGWHSWSAGAEGRSWFAAAEVAESMAAGAVVLGYYFAYWVGVRRRVRRHARGE